MSTQVASLHATIGADLSGLNSGLSTAQKQVSGFASMLTTGLGSALGVIGGQLINTAISKIVELGAGMVQLGKTAISMATDFESQMSILAIAASSTGLSFDQLHDAALLVGGDTRLVGVSASGAADAMTGLFKAGLTTTEIFGDFNAVMDEGAQLGGALRAAIDLAAATELDMVQASDLAAVALASFGAELETEAERAEFITEAMNNLVQAADASVAEVGDLAAALANIGPTASAMGISLQDTNNALAILSTRGITGAQAGTSLKSMLTNMQRTTPAVTDALKRLGVSLFDIEGNMKPLPMIIGELESALNGTVTTYTRQNELTAKQSVLLKDAKAAYGTADKAIRQHQAGIKVLSETSLKKYQDQYIGAKNVIENLNAAQGAVIPVTKKLTQEQRNQEIQTIAGTFGMNAMNTLLGEGVKGWDAMAIATANAADIQTQATAKANTFAGAWESAQGTLETVGIGIGEAFLPVLSTLANTLSGFVTENGPALTSFFSELGVWLSATLPVAIQTLAGFWTNTLAPAMAAVWEFIQANVIPLFTMLWTWLSVNLPIALQTLSALWTTMFLPALTTVWEIIQNSLIPVFTVLWTWLQTVLPLAIQVLSDIWNTYIVPMFAAFVEQWNTNIQPALAALWAWLQTTIPIAIQFLSDMWTNTLAPALAVVAEFITGTMVPLFGEILGWLIENLPKALEFLGNLWATVIWPAIVAAIQFATDTIIPLWTTIITWLQEVIPVALEFLRALWQDVIWPALLTAIETIWSAIEPIWTMIQTWLADTLPVALEFLRALWQDVIWPALLKAIETIWAIIKPIWEAIKKWLDDTLPIALEFLRSLWEDHIWPALLTAVETIWAIILPIWELIQAWLEDTLPDALEALRAMWEDHVFPALQAVVEAIWSIVEPIWIEIQTWLEETMVTALENLLYAWEEVVWPAIQAAIETAWGIIEPIWILIEDWLGVLIPAALTILQTGFEVAWAAIKLAVSNAWTKIEKIFDGIKTFANWLAGKTFKFKISLPKLPKWAKPGSDIPLLTGWKKLDDFMKKAKIAPSFDGGGLDDLIVDGGTFDAIRDFANWLDDHTFKFNVNMPDIPDWALPGSKLPLHEAWEDFANFVKSDEIRPRFTDSLVNVAMAQSADPVTLRSSPSISIHTLNVDGTQSGLDLMRILQGLTVAPMRV